MLKQTNANLATAEMIATTRIRGSISREKSILSVTTNQEQSNNQGWKIEEEQEHGFFRKNLCFLQKPIDKETEA